jgi:AcrR family transcriptional regulator
MAKAREESAPPRRREEVIDAAARIFHAKGYAAASIQDVADELGMLKGSLYHYIDSKQDLLFAIIEDVHRRTMEELEQWLALEADTMMRLRTFLHGQVLTYCRNVQRVGVFLNDLRSLSEDQQARIHAERDRYDHVLRDLIRTGQEEGVIDRDVDPKLAAMAIFGMLNWISTWWRPDGPSTPEQVASEFTDLALSGLVAREGARRGEIGRSNHDDSVVRR